jgi:hypothetical protein
MMQTFLPARVLLDLGMVDSVGCSSSMSITGTTEILWSSSVSNLILIFDFVLSDFLVPAEQ